MIKDCPGRAICRHFSKGAQIWGMDKEGGRQIEAYVGCMLHPTLARGGGGGGQICPSHPYIQLALPGAWRGDKIVANHTTSTDKGV